MKESPPPPPAPGASETELQRTSLVRMSSLQAGGRKGDVGIIEGWDVWSLGERTMGWLKAILIWSQGRVLYLTVNLYGH